jgi:hypothetical protein
MLARTMRVAVWCMCVIAWTGCDDRPLMLPDAAPPDASVDAPPVPGSIVAAVPAGTPDPAGGASNAGLLAALDDGGVIVAGTFSGTVSFASDKTLTAVGMRNGFVARYRSDTRLVWVRPLVVSGGDVAISGAAALPGDEVVVAGWFSGTLTLAPAAGPTGTRTLTSAGGLDGFVARLASDGSVRWAVRAGGPGDDIIRGLTASTLGVGPAGTTAQGHVYVAGAAGAAAVFGPGEANETTIPALDGPIFVASLSPDDGTLVWARFAGGGVPSQAYGVATGTGGVPVVLTGYVNGPAIFGAGTPSAVTVNPALGRAFVASWDGAGQLTWALGLGGAMGEGDAVTVDVSGEVVVTGTFEGSWGGTTAGGLVTLTADSVGQPGCFLARLIHTTGAIAWARRLVGRGVRPWHLHPTRTGDLLVAASFGGGVTVDPDGPTPTTIHAAGDDDALFVRLDMTGALRWATPAGGLGDDEGNDVAEASDGFVWASGSYVGSATFGAGTAALILTSGTDGAGFLARLVP